MNNFHRALLLILALFSVYLIILVRSNTNLLLTCSDIKIDVPRKEEVKIHADFNLSANHKCVLFYRSLSKSELPVSEDP